MKRVRSTSERPKTLRSSSLGRPRLASADVAAALGADTLSLTPTAEKGANPISFFTIRGRLSEELSSSGGRPGRKGANGRHKIPLTDQEWNDLKSLAESMEKDGLKTTPGQVAGVIISDALRRIRNAT